MRRRCCSYRRTIQSESSGSGDRRGEKAVKIQRLSKEDVAEIQQQATFSEVVSYLDPAEMHVDVSRMQKLRSRNVLLRVNELHFI